MAGTSFQSSNPRPTTPDTIQYIFLTVKHRPTAAMLVSSLFVVYLFVTLATKATTGA